MASLEPWAGTPSEGLSVRIGIVTLTPQMLDSLKGEDVMHQLALKEAESHLAELVDEAADGVDVVITREDGAAPERFRQHLWNFDGRNCPPWTTNQPSAGSSWSSSS